jgi:hypothetical protein
MVVGLLTYYLALDLKNPLFEVILTSLYNGFSELGFSFPKIKCHYSK